jgi:hypothetical protein
MALIDVQRQLLALCFRAEPSPDALAALGDARAFRAYREMVRERLWLQIRSALPRTSALVPLALFQHAFVWQLEHAPPRTRYFRGIVRAFADSALPLWAADASVPAAACDLLRYELALWEVSDLEAEPSAAYGEFSFDKVAVLSGALQLLEVSHAVHLGDDCKPVPHRLCVQRAQDGQRPRTWSMTKPTYALVQRLVCADASVAQCVRELAAEARVVIDAAYLDALCETLAQFIENRIVLGSR